MNRGIFSFFIFPLALLFAQLIHPATAAAQKKGYNISVKIADLKAGEKVMLAYHYGDKQYIKDTVLVNDKGLAVFKGETPLPGGIYLIVMPSMVWFETVIDKEQDFSIETTKEDILKNIKVTGSKDNEVFFGFQRMMSEGQEKLKKLGDAEKAEKEKEKPDQKELDRIKAESKKLTQEVENGQEKIKKDFPDSFLATVLKMMKDPEIPPAPKGANGQVMDSLWDYHFLKKHFFDPVDFSDEKILRTPVYQSRLMRYFNTMVIQSPDTLIKEIDPVIELSEANYEVFKFTLVTLFNKYVNSKVMGMDALYAHLCKRWYLSGKADWADSTQLAKMAERVEKISGNIIGKVAGDLNLIDPNENYQRLHGIKSTYTVVLFWAYDCGHCKTEVPQVKAIYDKYKADGVEVYAVNINNVSSHIKKSYEKEEDKQKDISSGRQKVKDEWIKFISEKQLTWINVIDYYNQSKFRDLYDIYSTPVIYLLDQDKKILAKRIGPETLEDFLRHELGLEPLKREKKDEEKPDDAPEEE